MRFIQRAAGRCDAAECILNLARERQDGTRMERSRRTS